MYYISSLFLLYFFEKELHTHSSFFIFRIYASFFA